MHSLHELKVAVIGLGYVGLPLAVEFSKRRPVVGFDINRARISALREGRDTTLEINDEELAAATGMQFTCEMEDLKDCNVFIATVPTPIDHYKRPDFGPLDRRERDDRPHAEERRHRDLRIDRLPRRDRRGLRAGARAASRASSTTSDFFVGYCPERINPGDKDAPRDRHQEGDLGLDAGSRRARRLRSIARSSRRARTRQAAFKVAEAAKVIENTQRDVNIALINELVDHLQPHGHRHGAVLQAAGTKWNFLPFRPGLVGGHCIGVDPYYLTHKAQAIGYHPEIILAGRRINDSMGGYVAAQLVKALTRRQDRRLGCPGAHAWASTFKENCPDLRNTKVVDIVTELRRVRRRRGRVRPLGFEGRRAARVRHRLRSREPAKGVTTQSSSPWRTSASRSWAGGDPRVRQGRAGSL